MPESRFTSAVRGSLEALLTDLQNTTEVLKRANSSGRLQSYPDTQEPIYEPQRIKTAVMTARSQTAHRSDLQDLEKLLDDYSSQRGKRQEARPTVESLLGQLDDAVPNGDVRRPGSASTATKELDSLMASLSDFKVTDPAYARPTKSPRVGQTPPRDLNQLDSMLGTLQTDLGRQGINTIPKGDCATCGKSIVGQVVIALGKMWHPEHFTCVQCGDELGHRNFFERAGKAYCENDYHNQFSPRCAYCNGPIKDKCVTALDKTWHPEHFACAHCGKDFGEDGFHEKEGKAYCRQDYFASFAPRCRGCQKAIMSNYITALKTQWHPECFVCQDCKQPFNGGSFFDHSGLPLCETHYHEKRGSLCYGCKKPISGRCVTAMGKKFHPEHFVCCFCRHQLNKGTFKEHENKAYCHKCFQKLLS